MSVSSSDDRSDRSDGPRADGSFLSLARAEALARCCEAVADARGPQSALSAALKDLCACAHRDGVLAEQLLVEIKQALTESARRRGLSNAESNDERARFVTLAIGAYYADELPPRGRR